MDEIFFVDKKGNKISSEEISSHIGLALQIIKQEQNLESEFKSSNEKNASIFLIKEKGYMAASETDIRNFIVYNSLNVSEEQKRILEHYAREQYALEDMARQINQEKEGER